MLEVTNLSVQFKRFSGKLSQRTLNIISHLDLSVEKGEIVAVVGSSGAGKSLLAHAILGILPNNAIVKGDISFKGQKLTKKRKALLRGKEIVLVPQSIGFLNPLCRVGKQVERAAIRSGKTKHQAGDVTDQTFRRYNLKSIVQTYFPFQTSGGMAKRILVSTATVGDADLIIADEPTAGLNQEVVNRSLAHFRELADLGKAVILITHDLNAALSVADKVAVFYGGCTLEIAQASDFNGANRLRHPYTKALWASLPQHEFSFLPGVHYLESDSPKGCVFSPQCPLQKIHCKEGVPGIRSLNDGFVRCYET